MGLDLGELAGPGANLLSSEGAEHVRLRRVVSRWFTPTRVEELSARVRDLVDGLLAPLTAAGGGDFMTDVARRVPGPVFCWLIGADPSRGDRVYALSEVLLRAFTGDPAHADSVRGAGVAMRDLVDELIAEKRRQPGDDLMSIMIAGVDAGEITIDDVRSLSFEMLSASTDNTAQSAAVAMALLLRHPDQWRALADDRGLASRAVEECARVEPRVRLLPVFAPADTTLLELDVAADEMVWMDIIGAHYDPEVYPDPYRFDVTREHARPQLNFGTGRHYCLGAALARLELRTLLETVAERWLEIRPAGEVVVDPASPTGTSVPALPISCVPR
jgi:cytochrome P450